jgi:hypothetical protein
MGRSILVGLAVVMALASAPGASANRVYGAFDPRGEALFTFELSDAPPYRIRAATVRMGLYCDHYGYGYGYPATFKIVRRMPPKSARNRDHLVLRPGRRARIRAVWGSARRHTAYTGTLSIGKVTERSARVRIRLRSSDSRDARDRCSGVLRVRARREPGVLYAGATDDGEPVWVRREGNSIEWLSGFGTGCRPRGYFEGIHADAIDLSGPSAFGWPGLMPGFSHGAYNRLFAVSAHVQGRLDGALARGTVRLVGAGGSLRSDRCDTGRRRWRARSA